MYKFGLPFLCSAGIFNDKTNEGSVDMMLAAVDCYPDIIHVVSFMEDGYVYNTFVEHAYFYKLYYGNADPEIVFTDEFSLDDFEPGAIESQQRQRDVLLSRTPTLAEKAAIQWQLDKFLRK